MESCAQQKLAFAVCCQALSGEGMRVLDRGGCGHIMLLARTPREKSLRAPGAILLPPLPLHLVLRWKHAGWEAERRSG